MSEETRFTVRRLGWHQAPHGDTYTRRLPITSTVAHFDNFDDAEYSRRDRERAARDGENPFRFGGAALYFQTSLGAPQLHDWLLDVGIDPPIDQLRHRDWFDWWNAFSHTWNEEQLHHAWNGLDKVRFFDVVEEPCEDTFHVVVRMNRRGPSGMIGEYDSEDGGFPVRVYRSGMTAVTVCRQMAERIQFSEETYWTRFVAFEVPGNVPRGSPVGHLVQRRTFDEAGQIAHHRENALSHARVPVQLFADRGAADAHRDELLRIAHSVTNPFQVFLPQMAGLRCRDFMLAIAQLNPPLPWPTELRPALWREWCDLCQDDMNDDQRAAMWALFEDHLLFDVLTVEVSDD